MANKTVSNLNELTTVSNSDILLVETATETLKVTKGNLLKEVNEQLNAKSNASHTHDEYVTENELNSKGLATETFVTNKIAEATLEGSEVDLSGYATKEELNLKADATIVDSFTLRYRETNVGKYVESRATAYTYKNQFDISGFEYNGLFHACAVVDVSKYLGQTIKVKVESHAINVSGLVEDSKSEQFNMFGCDTSNVNDGKFDNSTRTIFSNINFSNGEMITEKEVNFGVKTSLPYIKICHAVGVKELPASLKWYLNVYINDEEVSVLKFGGVFSKEKVIVTPINDSTDGSTGGGTVSPPSTEILDGIYVNGDKVLVRDQLLVDYINDAVGSSQTDNPSSVLKGKKWNILGDSISHEGAYTNKHYYHFIAERNGMTTTSYGVSGTRISGSGSAMCVRYANMSDDADIITVFGGVNDFGQTSPAPLGSFEDTDNNTFYGALHTLAKGLINKYPNKLILFITPMPQVGFWSHSETTNEFGLTVFDYGDAIKEVCGFYGIPVYDLGRCGGMTPKVPSQKSLYYTDGLHLNYTGHEKMSLALENELKKYFV